MMDKRAAELRSIPLLKNYGDHEVVVRNLNHISKEMRKNIGSREDLISLRFYKEDFTHEYSLRARYIIALGELKMMKKVEEDLLGRYREYAQNGNPPI